MIRVGVSILVLTYMAFRTVDGFSMVAGTQRIGTFLEANPETSQDEADVGIVDRRSAFAQASVSLVAFAAAPSMAIAKTTQLSEEYRQGTAALADSDENAPVPREAYKKLDSGLVYADLRSGGGRAASEGSKVNIQWVLRKSNGYFVDSSQVNDSVPFIFTVGDGSAIRGVDEGIRGMKEGGTRRLIIPVNMAYVDGVDDGKPGPLPVGFGPRQQIRRVMGVRKDVPGEYIFLEIQLTKVR